jgi:ABC-type nitrate/sulfonate/bicarbonate transport system, ATPase component
VARQSRFHGGPPKNQEFFMHTSLTSKFIEIQGVEQTFRTRKGLFPALQGIDLTIAQGEFVALIGHSGCGKSTLLNLIAGLNTPTAGALLCANKEIKGPGPERAVVFQNHSLLPWLTCFDNVHLAVERVFGKTETRHSSWPAPMRHWRWWALRMLRKSAPAKSRAA